MNSGLYEQVINQKINSKVIEDYITLGQGIDIAHGVREAEFKEIMRNTIIPFLRIAQNQGFGLWTPPQDKVLRRRGRSMTSVSSRH